MYDLLIKGGFIIDPYQGIEGIRDVAFKDGKVAKVEGEIDPKDSVEVLDASGKIVTPGFIDLHTHVYWGVSHFGVEADETCLTKGVTTVIDAGSSGALNFPGFKRFIIKKSMTRIYAFLHISSMGLTTPLGIGELNDFRYLDFDKAVEVAKENRKSILGVKIRLNKDIVGDFGPQALRLAKEAARKIGVPLMVHPGILPENLPLSYILSILEKGDILTHCLPPPYPPLLPHPSILNKKGEVIPEVWSALKRGVIFDVGHGKGSFSFSTAEKALGQGLTPTTISTDLHTYSINYPVIDLPTTLSKFMFLGLSLPKVIELSTAAPASVLGMNGKIGTLKEGAEGDAVVLTVDKGEFVFWDVLDEKRIGREKIKVVNVIKSGKIVHKA